MRAHLMAIANLALCALRADYQGVEMWARVTKLSLDDAATILTTT